MVTPGKTATWRRSCCAISITAGEQTAQNRNRRENPVGRAVGFGHSPRVCAEKRNAEAMFEHGFVLRGCRKGGPGDLESPDLGRETQYNPLHRWEGK